jgi:hypothetical protein
MSQNVQLQPFLVSRDNSVDGSKGAFGSDECLVAVAFMDVGVYVTSLRTLKNLLLVGDAVKSCLSGGPGLRLSFHHAFLPVQHEDPYKLVSLAKDTKSVCVTKERRVIVCNGEGLRI